MLLYRTESGGVCRDSRRQGLVEDALDAAVAAGVDFSRFDEDGDSHLDGLVVVHAGGGAEAEPDKTKRRDLIWSHKWTISSERLINGVSVWAYTLQPEDGRVGVFCHEFGHFLGLPDLYDTTGASEGGVGEWCVMGAGSWCGGGDQPANFSAWSLVKLGWCASKVVSASNASLQIDPVLAARSAVRLLIPGQPLRYYLLESRQRASVDRGLPGEGLLVWRIDETMKTNDNPANYMVGLQQADGAFDLENGANRGDPGDPFPGSTNQQTFNDGTRVVADRIQYRAGTSTLDVP